MRYIWAAVFLCLAGAVSPLLFPDLSRWWGIGACLLVNVLLVWLYIGVVIPMRRVSLGMALLKSGEYNNRLAKVGEPGADRLVNLFNTLMERLSEERLKLAETNHILNLVTDASPLGVAIVDFDGSVGFSNRAFREVVGMDGVELDGKSVDSLSGDVWENVREMADGEERVIRRGDMEIFKIIRRSFIDRGVRCPFILVERLTDDIRKAEKGAYGKVIRTMAHEVNNCVGGLASFLETVSEQDDIDRDIRELADSCLVSCRGLSQFISGYAEVVKMGEPKLQFVDLRDEVENALPFLNTMVPAGVMVRVSLPDERLRVRLDEGMFRQVLVNIVKNAGESVRDSGREDGYISIVAARERGRIRLEVEDNGLGISEESARHLFTPFHTTKPYGQGLGLTLTAEILRRHGCRFSLATGEEGKTRFGIWFAPA